MKRHKCSFVKGLLLLCLFPTVLHAQQKILPQSYQLREAKAAPQLKQLLVQQRTFIQQNKLDFLVSNTSVSEFKLDRITGVLPVTDKQRSEATTLINSKVLSQDVLNIIKQLKVTCKTDDRSYDARNAHYVPAIRFQECGNCWAYSSVGVLEISDIKVNHVSPPTDIDLSEKQIVACSGAGSCSGGWPYQVLEWLTKTGTRVMPAAQDPDNGTNGPCLPVPSDAKVAALDWGIVDPSAGLFNLASVDKIKEAICTYGSVSCCLEATPLFQNFAGSGVFKETASTTSNPGVNHAIVLIGWDDTKQAWLLRNSWGTDWGDQGYAWISYHTNNIGYGAIWVVAKK